MVVKSLKAAGAAALLSAAIAVPTASADTQGPTILGRGQEIGTGTYIPSTPPGYGAVLQGDGNFVLYQYNGTQRVGTGLWSTRTNGMHSPHGELATRVRVGGDGNVVLYSKDDGPICSFQTQYKNGAYLRVNGSIPAVQVLDPNGTAVFTNELCAP